MIRAAIFGRGFRGNQGVFPGAVSRFYGICKPSSKMKKWGNGPSRAFVVFSLSLIVFGCC
jgi:hypothetical protein